MSNILIKNGYVIDVNNKENSGIKDILIENSLITKVDKNIKFEAEKVIDANGKIVMPRFCKYS